MMINKFVNQPEQNTTNNKILPLVLALLLPLCMMAQPDANIQETMRNMLKHYSGKPDISVEYIINVFDQAGDESPDQSGNMLLFVKGDNMYYHYENYEYYQSDKGAVWINRDDMTARFLSADAENAVANLPQTPDLSSQLEMMMNVCDTIIYKGISKRKARYELELAYGGYEKVELLLDPDYAIFKTVYYYENAAYGYKSETLVKDLSPDDVAEIERKLKSVRKAITSKSVESYFSNFQFLEIE